MSEQLTPEDVLDLVIEERARARERTLGGVASVRRGRGGGR